RDQPGAFGAGDLGLIEAAAHWTAIALQNARLFEAERRRAVERATLIDAARAASSSLQVDQVVSIVAERMAKLLGVTSCAVSLWDREQNTITLLAEHIRSGSEGDARWYEPVSVADYPETQRALEEARAVQMRIDDPQLYGSGRDYLREMKSSALLMVPLIHQDEVIGLVELFEVGAPRTFQPDNIELIEMLAAQAAAAIANARLFEQVLSGRERMQTLSRRLVGIQETERTRIARELHDEVGQILTAIKIGIQTACESPSLDAARASLRDNLEIVDDAIGRVRDLSLELRPAMLDDLGLVATLRWYLDRQAQLGGFTTSLQVAAMEPRLASEVEVTCFRVVQEALTNVIRHARASRVNVSLEHVDEELVVSVEDDGVGFDVEASTNRAAQGASVGLLGMQERVLQHGGVIEIASSTGRGTRINARIPTSEDLGLERRTTRRR
ncbi:MAG: GAF domain-containing sensor histidine kinase, partial [Anaerolineales bacterium]